MAHDDSLEFGILGPTEVRRAGAPLTLAAAKPRALLAILLVNANQVVSSDRLIDDLWGNDVPATAQTTLQVYVMQLRRLLEPEHAKGTPYGVLVTTPPGYCVRMSLDALDVHRFERLVAEGVGALTESPGTAADTLRQALEIWRGDALADFSFEPFAQAPAARLEEMRVAALEKRIEADLSCGRHAELVGELQELWTQHPLREGVVAHLMLALYRSGRQADALETYQRARRTLVDELGIDPGAALQALERRILVQDPALDLDLSGGGVRGAEREAEPRTVLVTLPGRGDDRIVELAEQLARGPSEHDLVLARLLAPEDAGGLGDVAAEVGLVRCALEARGVGARAATFTSDDPAADVERLAARSETDLLLLVGDDDVLCSGRLDPIADRLLKDVLSDIALVVGVSRAAPGWLDAPVLVPFGAGQHDWAALELAAWLARGGGRALHILGTVATTDRGTRDASRLLADASLLIQRASGIAPVPRLVQPGHEGPVEAAADGGLLVIGLSEDWHREGLGMTRWAIAKSVPSPVVFVRKGIRPGGLAPEVGMTRFGWSVTTGA